MGGWSEDWRVMLSSTQDQIKLKLKFELSLATSPHSCDTKARDRQIYYSGLRVWCRFPTVVRIRLSQPPAGLGLGLGLSLAIMTFIVATNVVVS